jgi:hypothetical protein
MKAPSRVDWTPDEIAYLIENYQRMNSSQLAVNMPGRTAKAINGKRKKMGLLLGHRNASMPFGPTPAYNRTLRELDELVRLHQHHIDCKRIPRDYKPSHIECEQISDEIILAITIKRLICGTYGRPK